MTVRMDLIDVIRKELRRQASRDGLKVTYRATDKPDTVHVKGVLDLYELVQAILDR